jgi:hypothetical protein
MITDLLKASWNYFLIFWNMKIYLRWDQYNFFSLEGDQTKQLNWLLPFCLNMVLPFLYIISCWRFGMKVGFNTGCYWYSLLWPSIFNLGILKVACQKKPQEDGQGREGGKADNIGGEVGSIPPYPTFIPPGLKKFSYFFPTTKPIPPTPTIWAKYCLFARVCHQRGYPV